MKNFRVKERFIELRTSGLSYDKIAHELKVSKQTLIDWSKLLENDLSNQKAIVLDAICEKYFLKKQHRLSLFGEQLDRVKKELSNRDLSSVPTEKLFDILLKISSASKEEQGTLEFKVKESVFDIQLGRDTVWPVP